MHSLQFQNFVQLRSLKVPVLHKFHTEWQMQLDIGCIYSGQCPRCCWRRSHRHYFVVNTANIADRFQEVCAWTVCIFRLVDDRLQ